VIEAYNDILEENILEVFFVGDILPYGFGGGFAGGLSLAPSSGLNQEGLSLLDTNTVAFIHRDIVMGDATLTHEVGHCLDNGVDGHHSTTIFYPTFIKVSDVTVYGLEDFRRIQKADEFNCRKWREGSLIAIGSHLLSNP